MSELSELSRSRMKDVHPDLIKVVETAASNASFEILVVEGRRTVSRQKKLVAEGKSTTMRSRHLSGHAIDLCALVDGKLEWGKPYNRGVVELMKAAATEHDVNIEAGADWRTFIDFPHYQLAWSDYPAQDQSWVKTTPAKSEVKAVMRKSRKHKAAGWLKYGAGSLGGITAGWPAIKNQITIGQDIVATATQVLTANALTVVSTMLIISAIAFNWFQMQAKDDYLEGRYTPSGEDK